MTVARLTVLLIVLGASSPPSAQGLPGGLREHMAYSAFREAVTAAGWRSVRPLGPLETPRDSRAWDLVRDNGWTEAVDCASSGYAYCRFEFEDWGRGAVLVVTTAGEDDDPAVQEWHVEGTPWPEPDHGGLAAWPGIVYDGEGGCYYQWRATDRVYAYDAPRADARPVGTVDAGKEITHADRTRTLRILRAFGAVRARRDLRVQVVDPDPEAGRFHRDLPVPAGTLLETMWDAGGEGVEFRFDGVEYRGSVPATRQEWQGDADHRRDFEFEREPDVEEWVLLVTRPGGPTAWLEVTQDGIVGSEAFCEY